MVMRMQRCHTNTLKDRTIHHNARVKLLNVKSSDFTSIDSKRLIIAVALPLLLPNGTRTWKPILD